MLGVDYRADTALLLGFRYHMDGQSGLTRRFGTVDFSDPAAGKASHAQCVVKTDRAGGHHFNILDGIIAETHHGACTEIFLKMSHGKAESLEFLFTVTYTG